MDGFGAHAEFVLSLPEVLGWEQHAVFRGYNLYRRGEGWTLMLRATVKGKGVVAYYEAADQLDCWRELYRSLHSRAGPVWKPDKFFPGG